MDRNRARILIVDDDPAMVRTTTMILERMRYEVETASSGERALEAVRRQPFDVIFMDIRMPTMDGVETHRKIREIRPEASVVMITGYALEDLVQQALNDGARDVLHKPLDFDKVLDVIHRSQENGDEALVLVVDDDPAVRAALRDVLTKQGYRVASARTGEEAVDAARETHHDIILIDMKLPTINGLETYLRIRDHNPEAVAVMMTGYREEMAELVEAALDQHAYACLQKPFDLEALVGLVEEILEPRSREAGEQRSGGREGRGS